MRIAIIVPTLDEESALGETLANLLPAARQAEAAVVVSDGGSGDGTVGIARAAGVRLVEGPAGRGPQLNRGAAAVPEARVLLFLHADTRLPEGALEAACRAVAEGAVGGAFFLRFDNRKLGYRFAARVINLRTRLTRVPLGDQAQFVSRAGFEALGGFRDWPILEDVDFMRRLRRHGRTVLLPGPVTTASRRYRRGGLLATAARNWLIWLLYFLGVEPRRLARLYRHVR